LQNELKDEQEYQAKKKETMFAHERQIRLEQIEQRKQEKEMERQRRIANEQADMARARQLAQEEEDRKMNRKLEEKRAQDRILEENERNKQLRLQERMKQREYEGKLNRDYEYVFLQFLCEDGVLMQRFVGKSWQRKMLPVRMHFSPE
jgi:lipopolysaccharide export system protein LptC